VLSILMMIVAPLLTGVQIAQEVHENTLQPVTGTALSARQLVIGLTSGPLAQAGVLALPQAAIILVTAAIAGAPVPAVGFLILTVCAGGLLAMLTQLVGYGVGRRRAPGLVGIALMALLGGSLLAGTGIGLNIDREMIGLVTIVPQSGPVHLLREAFVPAGRLGAADAWAIDVRLVFSALAFIVLAGVVHLALERRIADRTGPSLRRIESWIAVGALILMALLSLPDFGNDGGAPVYLISLAMLVMPLMVVLMGRVPVGDGPSSMRKIPLRMLLAEFTGFILLHLAITSIAVGGPAALLPTSAAAVLHLSWALAVAALLAVRAVAVPLRLGGGILAAMCLVMGMGEFVFGVIFMAEAHTSLAGGFDNFFPLFELSAVLGVLQIALTVAVPWSLVRALRRGSAGWS
jgi:hypothetical protein